MGIQGNLAARFEFGIAIETDAVQMRIFAYPYGVFDANAVHPRLLEFRIDLEASADIGNEPVFTLNR